MPARIVCCLGLAGSTALFSSSASGESPGILEGKRETGFTLESIRRVGYLGWLERATSPWLKWTEVSVNTTYGRFGQTMFVQELSLSTLPDLRLRFHGAYGAVDFGRETSAGAALLVYPSRRSYAGVEVGARTGPLDSEAQVPVHLRAIAGGLW